jgi:hypothetical protein
MNDCFLSFHLFSRVARAGSFSAAGRELGPSQPSARAFAEFRDLQNLPYCGDFQGQQSSAGDHS